MANKSIRFSVIGLDHLHIYLQVDHLIRGGGELISFYAEDHDQIARFSEKYPRTKRAHSIDEILEDSYIDLIASASIPAERAPLGIKVMLHGKDFMVDKPGITSLDQLEEVRNVQSETQRIYSIFYAERFDDRSAIRAGELVKDGVIGKVIQTIGLGPHKIGMSPRPDWFFQKERYGGILVDIGSHQFDQFLFFTGSTQAEIVASHVGNFNHPEIPGFEDYGDVMIEGNGGLGHARVDWFTPDAIDGYGDGRLFILGTDGYIELRKRNDIAGRPGRNHLFLVNRDGIQYIDCRDVTLEFGSQLVHDVINRTETAMSQDHCFLAAQLSILADIKAVRLGHLKVES